MRVHVFYALSLEKLGEVESVGSRSECPQGCCEHSRRQGSGAVSGLFNQRKSFGLLRALASWLQGNQTQIIATSLQPENLTQGKGLV